MRHLLIVLGLLLFASPVVAAQDVTPTDGDSVLAGMGYSELHITVYNDHFAVPGLVPAGKTLIVLNNAGDESRHSFLLRLPDGLDMSNQPTGDEDAPPAWLLEASFPGFPGETLPGETNYAVVDLTPGVYVVADDFQASFVVFGPATGVTTEPEASATIDTFEFGFGMPATLAPGPQIWKITNSGLQPHELLLVSAPHGTTANDVIALLMSDGDEGAATPQGGLSLDDIAPVGGLGWVSPGAVAWAELNLEPGTYVALCFVFDPATGMPHAAEGMVSVFTVGEGMATPAA